MRTTAQKQALAAAIEACRDADGVIKKEAVVAAAKDTANVLHGEFPWDLEVAAQIAWLARAGELIKECREIVVYGKRQIAIPTYIPATTRSGYVRTLSVASNAALKKQALDAEVERIKQAIHRAMSLAIAFSLEAQFEEMLEKVVEIELELGRETV